MRPQTGMLVPLRARKASLAKFWNMSIASLTDMFFSPRASATIPPPLNFISNPKLHGANDLNSPSAYHQIEKFLDGNSEAHPLLNESEDDKLD
jgi:hypothetical protein